MRPSGLNRPGKDSDDVILEAYGTSNFLHKGTARCMEKVSKTYQFFYLKQLWDLIFIHSTFLIEKTDYHLICRH